MTDKLNTICNSSIDKFVIGAIIAFIVISVIGVGFTNDDSKCVKRNLVPIGKTLGYICTKREKK